MDNFEQFKDFFLRTLGYHSEQDLFENLYLKAIIDSISKIENISRLENKIRDALIKDLENENPLTQKLVDKQILILTWERWLNVTEEEKSRADICFSMSGFEFVVECKRLEFADHRYIEEGIKRFIELKYAEKDNFAGMLGFIISGNPYNIVESLKTKIKEYYPDSDMEFFLTQKVLGQALSFQSRHQRLNQKDIHLYHLFFDFTK